MANVSAFPAFASLRRNTRNVAAVLVLAAFTVIIVDLHVQRSPAFQTASLNSSQTELGLINTLETDNYNETRRILLWTTVSGRHGFYGMAEKPLSKLCGFKCEYSDDRTLLNSSHALVFHGWGPDLLTETLIVDGKNVTQPRDIPPSRDTNQFYVYMSKESPIRSSVNEEAYRYFFNWTATYRIDSDFPTLYGFLEKKTSEEIASYSLDSHEILATPNLVGWLVSNRGSVKSGRDELVQELKKHIPVHVYGRAGELACNSTVHRDCHAEIAMSHKFYLAFENSICRDYVTEKFFKALTSGMVPVVLGGANYGLHFPRGSFINVDSFASAKALANYLLYLDANDEEYLKYFGWRKYYKVQTEPYFRVFCRICKRLHEDYGRTNSVLDIVDWTLQANSNFPACIQP